MICLKISLTMCARQDETHSTSVLQLLADLLYVSLCRLSSRA